MRKKAEEDIKTRTILEQILEQRYQTNLNIPQKGSAIVLLVSGGMDSILLWGMLMKKYGLHVYPLYIAPIKENARSKAQKASIQHYASLYRKQYPQTYHKVYFQTHTWLFSFSQVIKKKMRLLNASFLYENVSYNSFYDKYALGLVSNPSRWYIYSSYALEYSLLLRYHYGIDIHTFVLGIMGDDGIYDKESNLAALRSVNLSLCLTSGYVQWSVLAPIDRKRNFYCEKKDMLRYSKELNLDASWTRSCDSNIQNHCGMCLSCLSRKEAFHKAEIVDNTDYSHPWYRRFIQAALSRVKHKQVLISKIIRKVKGVSQTNITPQFSPKDTISIQPVVTWHQKGKSVYVFNPNTKYFEELNSTASTIWLFVEKNSPRLEDIVGFLKNRFDQNESTIRSDTKEFICSFVRDGYLQLQKE